MTKKSSKKQFVVYVANDGCDDLQLWKIYRKLHDDRAMRDDFMRVVDESGEDYLYPASRLVDVDR